MPGPSESLGAAKVLKPSEELGLPVAEMEQRITESGRKTMKFGATKDIQVT